MALFSIYLQLPMYDSLLSEGLYLSLDYNRNPISRRILFVKQSDSTDMEEFLGIERGACGTCKLDGAAKEILRLYLSGGRLYPYLHDTVSPTE